MEGQSREEQAMYGRLLSKFYVKSKSVFVIMETCNDDATALRVVQEFVTNQIFENLAMDDHFGYMTLLSGRRPITLLHLEQKKMNTAMKLQQLLDQFVTRKMETKSS